MLNVYIFVRVFYIASFCVDCIYFCFVSIVYICVLCRLYIFVFCVACIYCFIIKISNHIYASVIPAFVCVNVVRDRKIVS